MNTSIIMKILLVSSNFPPEIGGPAASVEYISNLLAKKGITNSIVTNGTNKKYKDPKNVIRTPFVKQKKHSFIGSLLRMYYLFKEILKVGKNYDIFHSQDVNVSGLPTMLAAKLLRKPYIAKFSGDLYIEYQLRKNKTVEYALKSKTFIKFLFNLSQKMICNSAKTIIATSDYVKKYLLNLKVKPKNIKKIPNGVIPQEFDAKIIKKIRKKYGNKIICTSCRITKIKGIDTLIQTAEKLPNYNFVMFGDGKDKKFFEQTVKQNRLKNFHFYGRVNHNKVQSFIKSCKIFVLASYYEPFGIAVLDAMHANIPIIVSDSGGMKELVKDNTGLVFKTGDSADLVKKIKSIKKINLRNQKKLIKDYYWEKIIELYIKEYNK